MKNDITEHSDVEMALTVMNDEPLYKMATRRGLRERDLRSLMSDIFIFTDAQFDDLWQTVVDHHEEHERYLCEQGN